MQETPIPGKPIQRNPYDIDSDKSEDDEEDKDTLQEVPALLQQLKLFV